MSKGKSLKDQLKGIADRNKALGGYTHNKSTKRQASLLFSEREAADLDMDTVLEIGQQGITGLCGLDPAFMRFHGRLFARKAGMEQWDRSLWTDEENSEYDADIAAFMRLAQPYFQERCCIQALEWLIRGLRVNELNVKECMECALPHHDTDAFVRFMQILYFKEDDPYGFLFEAVKQKGEPVTRSFIAKRCLRDRRILEWAFSAFAELDSHYGLVRPADPRFITMLILDYIELALANPKQDPVIALHCVLTVIESMINSHSDETVLGGLLLIGTVMEKRQVGEDFVQAVIKKGLQHEKIMEEMTLFILRCLQLRPDIVNFALLESHRESLLSSLSALPDVNCQSLRDILESS